MAKKEITDEILVRNIKKKNCSDSIIELKNRHIGLVIDIYGKYGGVLTSMNYSPYEFNNEIHNIIYNSAKSYNDKKNTKFSTYLGNMTKYYCLDKITALSKEKTINDDPDNITKIIDECSNKDNNNSLLNKELCDYIMSLLNQINDDRIIKIFNYRYFDGKNKMTWKQIGKKIGITSQSCINLHSKAVKLLKNKLTSNTLYDKV
jgi:hypothetical protein